MTKKAAASNLFASAVANPDQKPAAPKKSKDVIVHFGRELDELAEMKAVIEALESKFKTGLEELKARAAEHFVKEGAMLGRRPANFKASGERSIASVQLKTKGAASKINEEEAKILEEAGIPYSTTVDPGVFYFNPELNSQPEKLEKISKALSKIPELAEMDIIKFRSETVVRAVDDASMEALFEARNPVKIDKFLHMVSTTAVAPKLNADVDLGTALEDVVAMFRTAKREESKEL